MKIGIAGYYQFQKMRVLARDASGEPTLLSKPEIVLPWWHNNITNAGLDMLGDGTGGDKIAYCRLGTGNTAPSNSDTGLVAQVGASNTAGTGHNTTGIAVDTSYVYRRVVKRFAAGSVSGVNLAEVAFAPASTGNVFSRELLRDAAGNATTITLDADEILDVLYELRYYLPANDTEVATTIDGAANTVTIRHSTNPTNLMYFTGYIGYPFRIEYSSNNYAYYGWAQESNALPAASSSWVYADYEAKNKATITYSPYTAGDCKRTAILSYSVDRANFTTGIGAIYVGTNNQDDYRNWCAWPGVVYGFATHLNKTASRKATVVISISWARHT